MGKKFYTLKIKENGNKQQKQQKQKNNPE